MAVSENIITTPSAMPSRRSFITRTAAVTAGVAIGATASAAAVSAPSLKLNRLIADFHHADAAHDIESDRYDAALAEVRRLCPRPSILAESHRPLSTVDALNKRQESARNVIAIMQELPEPDRTISIAAVHERLELIAIERQYIMDIAEAECAIGLPELEALHDTAHDATAEAELAVFSFSATSAEDIAAKLRFAASIGVIDLETECSERDLLAAVLDDLDRIAGKAVTA